MMYKNIFLLLGQSSSAKRSAELAAIEKYFCLRFGETLSEGSACGTRGFEEYFFIVMERPGGTRDYRRIFFNRLGETSAELAAIEKYFCLRYGKPGVQGVPAELAIIE